MSGLCNLIWRYFLGWEAVHEVAGSRGSHCIVPFRSCSPLPFRVHGVLCLMAFNSYFSLWASSLLSKYKMIGLNILTTSVGCKPQSSGGQRVPSKALAGSVLSGAMERLWPSVSSSHTHLLAWGHVTTVSACLVSVFPNSHGPSPISFCLFLNFCFTLYVWGQGHSL